MRVLLADDLRVSAEQLAQRLSLESEISDVVVVSSLQQLRAERARQPFDLALVMLAMPDALAILRETAVDPDRIPTIVLGVPEIGDEAIICAEAGASGYLFRSGTYVDLIRVIHSVCRGETICPPHVAAALLRRVATLAQDRRPPPPHATLTPREREVLGLVERGLSNKQIARRLGIEIRTVKNHVHNILRKLDAGSRGEAVARVRHRLDETGLRPAAHGQEAGLFAVASMPTGGPAAMLTNNSRSSARETGP